MEMDRTIAALIVFGLVLVWAGFVAGQPSCCTDNDESNPALFNTTVAQVPRAAPSTPIHQPTANSHAQCSCYGPPWLYTAFKRPEWWLVILAIPSLIYLIKQARANELSALAARENIGIFISKERGRIAIDPVILRVSENDCGVEFEIRAYGTTEATVHESYLNLMFSKSVEPPEEMHIGAEAHFPNVVVPNAPPTKMDTPFDRDEITECAGPRGKAFLHFTIFVRYTDIFQTSTQWEFSYHHVWSIRVIDGNVFAWETGGTRQSNERETKRRN